MQLLINIHRKNLYAVSRARHCQIWRCQHVLLAARLAYKINVRKYKYTCVGETRPFVIFQGLSRVLAISPADISQYFRLYLEPLFVFCPRYHPYTPTLVSQSHSLHEEIPLGPIHLDSRRVVRNLLPSWSIIIFYLEMRLS